MKNYLILSIKRSRGEDYAVWYMPNHCGYTVDINQAGRYTEEEAKDVENSTHGNCKAISEKSLEEKRKLLVVNIDYVQ